MRVRSKGARSLLAIASVAAIVGLVAVHNSDVVSAPNVQVEASSQLTVPKPTSDFYVYDGADVLSSEVESLILSVNRNYEQTEEKPQVVVATVPSMDGAYIEEYAVEMFEQWGIGDKDTDNGALLLIAEDERQIRIEIGYGLEGAITDSYSGQILDANIEALKASDYNTAVEPIFTALATAVNDEFGLDHEQMIGYVPDIQAATPASTSNNGSLFGVTINLIPLGLFVYFGVYPAVKKTRKRKAQRKLDEAKVRDRWVKKYPDKDISDDVLEKQVRKLETKRTEQAKRTRALNDLAKKVDQDEITESMIVQRIAYNIKMDKRRAEAEAARRRRNNRRSGGGGGSFGGSSGGGGQSGGGGASRGF